MRKIIKNSLITLLIILLIVILLSCKFTKLSDFDKKVCVAYKIGLQKENSEKSHIEKLASIVEDREDFVLLKIGGIWYILAINDYNYMKNGDDDAEMFKIKGWRVSQKAKFGDYAEAPALLSDMAESNYERYHYDLININKALHLKFEPNL